MRTAVLAIAVTGFAHFFLAALVNSADDDISICWKHDMRPISYGGAGYRLCVDEFGVVYSPDVLRKRKTATVP